MRHRLNKIIILGYALLTLSVGAAMAQSAAPVTCESLASLKLADTTITSAAPVTRGASISNSLASAKISTPVCRVVGFLTPTSDSHIGFEVWLPPVSAWNHKYEAVGNGGFLGGLNYRGMLPAFNRGYATMTTDEGHINIRSNPVEDVSWAYEHPEKFIDYAYRGEHVATLAAKEIVKAYYGGVANHAYYAGCSAGGIQGMVELLRFPKDYDGYIIGDATPNHMNQEIGAFWNALATSLADTASAIPPNKLSLIHAAVLKQCAGKDGGLKIDAFLTDPSACRFEPKTLQCKAGQDTSTCLTQGQVAAVEKVYDGPTDPRTHKHLLAGLTPGSELTWDRFFVGKTNPVGEERPWAGFMAYVAIADPDYLTKEKYLSFNFGSDYKDAQNKQLSGQTLESIFNTRSRNLDPVKTEGGKIIHYHGWDDGNIPSKEAVDFYTSVNADQARRHHLGHEQAQDETQEFYRLFMVSGMGHCSGGDGPSNFGQVGETAVQIDPEHDTLSALDQWVEQGIAPDKFIGSDVDAKTGAVGRTRPICAYPKKPVWTGTGSMEDAKNFVCSSKP